MRETPDTLSAAQAPINFDALAGTIHLDDEFLTNAQSKLALTQWTRHFARHLRTKPGAYFDNDRSDFGPAHENADDDELNRQVYEACLVLIPAP